MKLNHLLILGTLIIGLLGSCEDQDKPQETIIKNVTVSDITGSSAVVKIQRNDITNGYIYVKYPESTYLYYGTSSNVEEMKDVVVGRVEGKGIVKDELIFNLKDLKQDTQYWFAIRVDTIYANGTSNGLSLVNDQGYKGFLIPSDNSFKTIKYLPPVDLGLSVLWAQCDLRVNEIWHTATNYWCVTAYTGKEKPTTMNIAGTVQDNATAILGEDWHTPTVLEYRELIDNCNWEIRMNPDWGAYMRFTSRINGNHIDMYPNTGGMTAKWEANYWTANVSDLGSDNSSIWKVYQFTFNSLQENTTDWFKSILYTSRGTAQIRPVKKK